MRRSQTAGSGRETQKGPSVQHRKRQHLLRLEEVPPKVPAGDEENLLGDRERIAIETDVRMGGPPSREVGLDPGKKNILTTMGSPLYTARQRNFESHLSRYRSLLKLEKEKSGTRRNPFKASISQQQPRHLQRIPFTLLNRWRNE